MTRARSSRSSGVVLLALAAGAACGVEPSGEPSSVEELDGYWFDLTGDGAWNLTPEQLEEARRLGGIGYADGYEPAPVETGVTLHDPERAEGGLNLFCSGHAPEAVLMDMSGTVLHRWSYAYADVPGAPDLEPDNQRFWRRVHLLEDGTLLAIFEGLALIALDRDSRLLWAFPGHAHHDLDVAPDGRILVLTRRPRMLPRLNPRDPILEEWITTLSPEGQVLDQLSVVECLLHSRWAGRLMEAAKEGGDILHTNTLDLLDEREAGAHASWRAGNFLICSRQLDALAVVDPERKSVVWLGTGDWKAPHQPTIVQGGRVLLFDNMGHQGYSKVLEFDPRDGAEAWAFRGNPPPAFFSMFCGSVQRLPGGNTLVTETGRGRAFELTSGGEVVWEFVSPHRAGARKQLVAALFEVIRLPTEWVAGWLER